MSWHLGFLVLSYIFSSVHGEILMNYFVSCIKVSCNYSFTFPEGVGEGGEFGHYLPCVPVRFFSFYQRHEMCLGYCFEGNWKQGFDCEKQVFCSVKKSDTKLFLTHVLTCCLTTEIELLHYSASGLRRRDLFHLLHLPFLLFFEHIKYTKPSQFVNKAMF